jgi:hypothetical protein
VPRDTLYHSIKDYRQVFVVGDCDVGTEVNVLGMVGAIMKIVVPFCLLGVHINGTEYELPYVITVKSGGRLVFHIHNSSNEMSNKVCISDVKFRLSGGGDLPFISGTGSHIIYDEEFVNSQSLKFFLHNVVFIYTNTLTVPIISLIQIERYSFNLTEIVKEEESGGEEQKQKDLSVLSAMANAEEEEENVCVVDMTSPAVWLMDSYGFIFRSEFRNIDTGAIWVSGGNLILLRIYFSNNTVSTVEAPLDEEGNEYLIRHNVHYLMGAEVVLSDVITDTGLNLFVSGDPYSTHARNGTKMLVSPEVLSVVATPGNDSTTTFVFCLYKP